MPSSAPSDESGVLVEKLKHAFATYDHASKKYLTAVKDLDCAMEQVAIAFRELSQGELNETTKSKCDAFCAAVDGHKCGTASASSKGKKLSTDASGLLTPAAGHEEEYYFSIYMTDMAREITAPLEALRAEVKQLAKSKEKRDLIVKKYEKARHEVDSLETKLAKKNQSVADSEDYAKKVAKRDEKKALKEAEESKFESEYQALLNKRSEVVNTMVTAMMHFSPMYYEGLSKVLRPHG